MSAAATVPAEYNRVTVLFADVNLQEVQACGDKAAYRDYRDRHRAMANSLGFEGHMMWAEAMG
jgi:hypothetical protein